MEPLGSGHRDPEGGAANIRSSIAKAAALLGYELKNEQEESVFQFSSGKGVCLPVMASHCAMKFCPSINSVDIKYARINCIATKGCMEGFRPRAGDVIHPVLWLVKGRAIARLKFMFL